jgi:hypothetical protein
MAVSNPYVIPLPWKNMLLVLFGSLALWFLPWLAWPLSPVMAGRESVRKPPVFRYVKAVPGLDGSTWSPVLMPLPTADGFSKKAAIHEMPRKSAESILKLRVSDPLYLAMEPDAMASLSGAGMAALSESGFEPDSPHAPVFAARTAPADGGIQIEILGGLKSRKFAAPALERMVVPATGSAAVSATAIVGIDRLGRVGHVLLEQPSGVAAVDSDLVRGLRAGMGVPGEGPASGQVRVFFWKREQGDKE